LRATENIGPYPAVFCYILFGSRSEFFGTEDGMIVSVEALQNPKETIFVLEYFSSSLVFLMFRITPACHAGPVLS
jgi:hypothetical protein